MNLASSTNNTLIGKGENSKPKMFLSFSRLHSMKRKNLLILNFNILTQTSAAKIKWNNRLRGQGLEIFSKELSIRRLKVFNFCKSSASITKLWNKLLTSCTGHTHISSNIFSPRITLQSACMSLNSIEMELSRMSSLMISCQPLTKDHSLLVQSEIRKSIRWLSKKL